MSGAPLPVTASEDEHIDAWLRELAEAMMDRTDKDNPAKWQYQGKPDPSEAWFDVWDLYMRSFEMQLLKTTRNLNGEDVLMDLLPHVGCTGAYMWPTFHVYRASKKRAADGTVLKYLDMYGTFTLRTEVSPGYWKGRIDNFL